MLLQCPQVALSSTDLVLESPLGMSPTKFLGRQDCSMTVDRRAWSQVIASAVGPRLVSLPQGAQTGVSLVGYLRTAIVLGLGGVGAKS